jgi:hypothetical protein
MDYIMLEVPEPPALSNLSNTRDLSLDTIILKHLRMLYLTDSLPHCANLYACISHPQSTIVNLNVRPRCQELDRLQTRDSLAALLRACRANADDSSFTSLDVSPEGDGDFSVPVRLQLDGRVTLIMPLLDSYCLEEIKIPRLKSLSVAEDPFTKEFEGPDLFADLKISWMDFFLNHPSIEELMCNGQDLHLVNATLGDVREQFEYFEDAGPLLAELLRHRSRWAQPTNPPSPDSVSFLLPLLQPAPVLLPSLKSLSLTGAEFIGTASFDFEQMLTHRTTHGCTLASLQLSRICDLNEALFKRLTELMPEGGLVWDQILEESPHPEGSLDGSEADVDDSEDDIDEHSGP